MRERQPGVWELIVSVGRDPLSGKWKRRSRTVRGTKRNAQRALADLVHEVTTGAVRPADITVGAALDRWLELACDDLSPTTLREYRRLLDRRIRPALGERQLSRLSTADLDAFYSALSHQAGLAPATIRQIHSILRRGLRQAVRWGWIGGNPAINTTLPRRRRAEIEPPSPAVIRSLLDAAIEHDATTGTLMFLAARTGMRRGELCGLKWDDVDLARAKIVVSRAVAAVPDGTIEKTTKTHASRRIALDKATVATIARYRQQAEEWAACAGTTLGPMSFVFSRTIDGERPLHPDNVTAAFRRLCERERITGVRLHDLRHAHATQLLAAGVPVRTVSGRLGHASAMTTLNVYAHALEESDEHAAQVIGEIFDRSEFPK
jgi:integrase